MVDDNSYLEYIVHIDYSIVRYLFLKSVPTYIYSVLLPTGERRRLPWDTNIS